MRRDVVVTEPAGQQLMDVSVPAPLLAALPRTRAEELRHRGLHQLLDRLLHRGPKPRLQVARLHGIVHLVVVLDDLSCHRFSSQVFAH